MVPRGNRGSRCAGGGLQAGGFGDAQGVCCCACGAFCVCPASSVRVARGVYAVVRSRRWDSRGPPGAGLPVCTPLPHSPHLQRAARRGLGGVRGVVSQSPRRPVWLPHPPGPGPRTWWWPVPCPGPFCSRPASGLRAPSVGGTGGLSQLLIEVAACFPSRAWELDPLQVPGRPVPKGFQADLPENPQPQAVLPRWGLGWVPQGFCAEQSGGPAGTSRLSRLRNTRPRRGP